MSPEHSGETRFGNTAGDNFSWTVDLIVVFAALLIGVAVVVTAPQNLSDVIRVIIGLPLVLLLPGYALIAAAFPSAGPSERAALGESFVRWEAPTVRERLALAPVFSLLLIPIASVPSSWIIGRFSANVVLACLSVLTAICLLIAIGRRLRQPVESRFAIRTGGWSDYGLEAAQPKELVATLFLLVSILLATTMVGYAAIDQNGSAGYTHMYLSTQSSDGEFRSAEYPEQLTVGESTPLYVGIQNNEGRQTSYTIVVLLQRVDTSGAQTTVLAQREIDRASATLASGEGAHVQTTLTPTRLGSDLRLTFLLYRGQPADTLSTATAYRYTYIWVDVVDDGAQA